jgi:hypothetical protein
MEIRQEIERKTVEHTNARTDVGFVLGLTAAHDLPSYSYVTAAVELTDIRNCKENLV